MTYNNLANNFLVSTSPRFFTKPIPIGAETNNHSSAPTCLPAFAMKNNDAVSKEHCRANRGLSRILLKANAHFHPIAELKF